jgi:hypothetical protein
MERGTVSSRVALLLRCAEVKPLFERFVFFFSFLFFPSNEFYDSSFLSCHIFVDVSEELIIA